MGFSAGAIEGGIHFDISEFAHGMLEAEAISSVFPPMVAEFLEHPLLGFTELAKETARTIGETIEEVAGHFHQMGLESEKAGVSAQMFSTISAAAAASGVSVEQLGNTFKFLEERASQALSGDSEGMKGFNDLGIKMRELRGLTGNPEELFLRLADAIQAIPEPAQRMKASMEVMQRAGSDMIPFLSKGREGILDLANQMGALGAGVDDAESEMGEKWGLMEAKFSAAWMGIKKAVAEPILAELSSHMSQIEPIISEVTGSLRKGLGEAMQFVTMEVEQFWPQIVETGKALEEDLGKAMQFVTTEVEQFWPQISEAGKALKNDFKTALEDLGPTFKEFVKDATKIGVEVLPLLVKGFEVLEASVKITATAINDIMKGWQYLYNLNSDLPTAQVTNASSFNASILGEGTKHHVRDGTVDRFHPGNVNVTVQSPKIVVDTAATTNKIAGEIVRQIKPKIDQAAQTQNIARAVGARY